MFGNYLIETVHTNYPSDMSDAEWALIRPLMTRNKPNGCDMTTSMRDVVNAIFYQNRTGCQWRYLPQEFPVKVPPQAGEHGYNGHKCVNGRQRHILVDTLGLLLEVVVVTAANLDDRVGAQLLAYQAQAKFPRLKQIWADSGYVGAKWQEWFQWFCGWVLEIVKRSDPRSEFHVVPRRWVVALIVTLHTSPTRKRGKGGKIPRFRVGLVSRC